MQTGYLECLLIFHFPDESTVQAWLKAAALFCPPRPDLTDVTFETPHDKVHIFAIAQSTPPLRCAHRLTTKTHTLIPQSIFHASPQVFTAITFVSAELVRWLSFEFQLKCNLSAPVTSLGKPFLATPQFAIINSQNFNNLVCIFPNRVSSRNAGTPAIC
jgi:hypothetical protein